MGGYKYGNQVGGGGNGQDIVARAKVDEVAAQLADIAKGYTSSEIVDVNIQNARSIRGERILNIPAYVGDEVVHPSVYYNPDGWNGYKYWMAYTPYQASNDQTENPSIAASQNGIDWVVPNGVTNPLENIPGFNGYNSDTHLVMSPNGKTLHLIYREYVPNLSPNDERLILKSSTDGINWTPKKSIIINNAQVSRPVSPAVVWNGKEYAMFYVDLKTTPKKIWKRTCPTIDGTWSAPVETNISPDVGKQLWHIDVQYYKGVYICLAQTNTSDGGMGNLVIASSTDGISWDTKLEPLISGSMYRSCFVPKMTNDGLELSVWYSCKSSVWKIGFTTIHLRTSDLEQQKLTKILSGMNKIPPYLIGDTFNRVDSTTGLGVASSGQTWINQTTPIMGLINGEAYPVTSSNTRAVIDSGNSEISVSCDIAKIGNQAWIIGRMLDGSNYLRYGISSGLNVILQKIEGGVSTELFRASSLVGKDGSHLEMKLQGSKVSLYYNGLFVTTVDTTFNQTATMVGIQGTDIATRFDNFSVKKI